MGVEPRLGCILVEGTYGKVIGVERPLHAVAESQDRNPCDEGL